LIEENGCSLVKINNAAYKPFKLALRGLMRKACSSLHLFLREQPLIQRCVLIMNFSVVLKQTFWSIMSICCDITVYLRVIKVLTSTN